MQYSNTCESVSSTKGRGWSLCISSKPSSGTGPPRATVTSRGDCTLSPARGSQGILVPWYKHTVLLGQLFFPSGLWSKIPLHGSVCPSLTLDSDAWLVTVCTFSLWWYLGEEGWGGGAGTWGTYWVGSTHSLDSFGAQPKRFWKRFLIVKVHFLDKVCVYRGLVPEAKLQDERGEKPSSIAAFTPSGSALLNVSPASEISIPALCMWLFKKTQTGPTLVGKGRNSVSTSCKREESKVFF